MRQSSASPVRTVMNNRAAGLARQRFTDSCWNTSYARKRHSLWATPERPPGAADRSRNGCPSCLQELAERLVNGRAFALGAIGGAGVSVELAVAARAVAWTVQRPGRRLNRGSACVRGSQAMPMSLRWIWGQEE
jgi:hypothetical protein